MAHSILVIDDEQSIRDTLTSVLKDEGYRIETAADGTEALERIRRNRPDLMLLDIWMPGIDGLETLQKAREIYPTQTVIMMSGHGTIETAVKSTKFGAYDFIEKPISLERLLVTVRNACNVADLARENAALRNQSRRGRKLIGSGSLMSQLRDLIQRIAPTTGSVLITGENGTGKELVAHNIHLLSNRSDKPFVEVNCAAIPEELIESELFGHEKGAFTGATQMKRGKFDLAHGGTIFLDEIGDMSLKTQAKILRIVQERKFERVGGNHVNEVDVRILAATNKNLPEEIKAGHFREDLFYRLNVIPFQVPALRDRVEDVPELAESFIREFSILHDKPQRPFTAEAIQVLQTYPWPGNVREFRNLIERLVILTTDSERGAPLTASCLLDHLKGEVSGFQPMVPGRNLRDARHEFERQFILRSLKENDWNVSKTAQALGVERSHLHRKIKSFGIEVEG